MKNNWLSDSHVHTRLCGHADGEMDEYVQTAIDKGLDELVFLEHLEEGIVSAHRTWLTEEQFELYWTEGNRLREQYADTIKIGLGVECGYNPDAVDRLRDRLQTKAWSEVGLSCHFLRLAGEKSHLNLFSKRDDSLTLARRSRPDILLSRYFDLLLAGVETLPVTKVCHLDGALRWLPGLQLGENHYKQIESLLRTMHQKGIGLEINTSGIRIRGEQFPTDRILSQAREFGIHLILGSDAHTPQEIAQHFSRFR